MPGTGLVPYTPQNTWAGSDLSSNSPDSGTTGRTRKASMRVSGEVTQAPRTPSKARRTFGLSRTEIRREEPKLISCRPPRSIRLPAATGRFNSP